MAYLILAVIVCVVWAVVAAMSAVNYCQKHGVAVNLVLLRLEVLKCLSRYRALTKQETGRVGSLFYHYIVSINAALVLTIVALLIQFA